MANENRIPADDEQVKQLNKPLRVSVTPTDKHVLLDNFQPKPGEYHLISVDTGGNEIKGSDFSATERAYKKHYSDTERFKVKKNPKI